MKEIQKRHRNQSTGTILTFLFTAFQGIARNYPQILKKRAASGFIPTQFYGFDGSKIISLGTVQGMVQPEIPGIPYNNSLRTDGSGMIIPAFGLMEFVTPNIVIAEVKFADNKLTDVQLDLSAALNKQYALSLDTTVFFDAADPVPEDFTPNYDQKNYITLKQGDKITITRINGFEWVAVTLPEAARACSIFPPSEYLYRLERLFIRSALYSKKKAGRKARFLCMYIHICVLNYNRRLLIPAEVLF